MSVEQQLDNIQKAFIGYCVVTGAKYAYVTVTPTDKMRLYFNTCNVAQEIINDIPKEYRDHIVTIEPTNTFGLQPVFEGEWQKKFYEKEKEYINEKASFYDNVNGKR